MEFQKSALKAARCGAADQARGSRSRGAADRRGRGAPKSWAAGRTRAWGPEVRSGHGGLQDALGLGDAVALGIVHAEAGEHLDDLGVLGEFGDGLLAGE